MLDDHQSLEEVLRTMSTPQSPSSSVAAAVTPNTRTIGATPDAFAFTHDARGGQEEIDDVTPTSWSFAARQRIECVRVVRSFRWVSTVLQQELRGLALEHAELLLGALRRTVIEGEEAENDNGVNQSLESRMKSVEKHVDGGGSSHCVGGKGGRGPIIGSPAGRSGRRSASHQAKERIREEVLKRKVSKWRYMPRPQPAGDNRWATPVDEEELPEVSTLALEASLLEGTGVGPDDVKEWRETFRRRVSRTGGARPARELCALPRYEQRFRLRPFVQVSCRAEFVSLHAART